MTRPYFDYLKGKWIDGYKPRGLEFSNLMDQLNDMDNIEKNNSALLNSVLEGEFDEAELNTYFQDKIEEREKTYAPRLTNLEESVDVLDREIILKVNKDYVDAQLNSIVSGSPKESFETLAQLISKYPNGAQGVYLVVESGHWYYWNEIDNQWIDGGEFSSAVTNHNNVVVYYGENAAKNSDFSNGTSQWYPAVSELSIRNDHLVIKGIASSSGEFLNKPRTQTALENITYESPRKIYVAIRFLVNNNECLVVDGETKGITGNNGTKIVKTFIENPEANREYLASAIFETLGDGGGNANLSIRHGYDSNASAVNKEMELFKVLVLDLTSIFGAGNEPTKEYIDKKLEKFEDSWFDGNEILINITDTVNDVNGDLKKVDEKFDLEVIEIKKKIEKNNEGVASSDGYTKYMAQVKNRIDANQNNKKIRILATFEEGECRNENCILVKDEEGNVIPHQWENDNHVNKQYDYDMGRYYDGSLKNGYIWIVDSLESNETKNYDILVYTKEVSSPVEMVSSIELDNSIELYNNDIKMTFNKSEKFLLKNVLINNVSKVLDQNPAFKTTPTSTATTLLSHPTTTVKSVKVNGNGVIFKELELELTNGMFNFILKTRLYKNGYISMNTLFKAKRTLLGSEIAAMQNRVNFEVTSGVVRNSSRITNAIWQEGGLNKYTFVKYAHGDVPRDDNARPTYPSMSNCVPLEGNLNRIIGGWEYLSNSTLFDIPKDETFICGIDFSLIENENSSSNVFKASFNEMVGRISKKTKYKIKKDMNDLIKEFINNTMTEDLISDGGTWNFSPYFGMYAEYKLFGTKPLSYVVDKFKTLLERSTIYSYDKNNPYTSLKASWDAKKWLNQIACRHMPLVPYLIEEFRALEDEENVNYFENLLKAYAEIFRVEVVEKGFTPLNRDSGAPVSNGVTAGLKALSMGIWLEPSKTSLVTAYLTNLSNLDDFKVVDNIYTDRKEDVISRTHYLHYTSFTLFELLKSLEFYQNDYLIDVSSYNLQCSAAYGGLKEHEYCISTSRRGAGHTNAYVAYLLYKEGDPSSLEQALMILKRMVEQSKPIGGHEYPFELWRFEPGHPYKNTASFEMQVLLELLLLINKELKIL